MSFFYDSLQRSLCLTSRGKRISFRGAGFFGLTLTHGVSYFFRSDHGFPDVSRFPLFFFPRRRTFSFYGRDCSNLGVVVRSWGKAFLTRRLFPPPPLISAFCPWENLYMPPLFFAFLLAFLPITAPFSLPPCDPFSSTFSSRALLYTY